MLSGDLEAMNLVAPSLTEFAGKIGIFPTIQYSCRYLHTVLMQIRLRISL